MKCLPRLTGVRFAAAVLIAGCWSADFASAQSIERELSSDDSGWITTKEQPKPGTAEGDLHAARRALAEGDHSRAKQLTTEWMEAYPEHSLYPEALLIHGDATTLAGEPYEALYDYEAIARGYPASEAFPRALERECDIADRFAAGEKHTRFLILRFNAYEEAEELYIRVQERLPGSQLAQRAGRTLADFYYERKQMELAATAYDLYLQNFPNAPDAVEATKRLVYSHLASAKGPAFDPSGLYEARQWLEVIENRSPAESEEMGASSLQNRIDESDANHYIETARFYLRRNDLPSVRFTLERLVKRYPTSLAARRAYSFMLEMGWMQPPGADTSGEGDETAPDEAGLQTGRSTEANPSTDAPFTDERAARPTDQE